ncbi:MAG: Uma2 family endonuclease [Planctomycetes bacterium]|nr:Uma2 family endonuclease [Planctomycetota bacterium]
MATTTPMTAEQLLNFQPSDARCELIEGELRMMSPSGWLHAEIIGILTSLLGHHVVQNRLGKIFGAEGGFLIGRDPDTVLGPDIAFIARENLPQDSPTGAFWPGAPDLAVEVLSPNDRTGEVDEKIKAWLDAGTRLVWIVDPRMQTVTIYRSSTDVVVKTAGDVLDGGDIVVGFSTPVDVIFAISR